MIRSAIFSVLTTSLLCAPALGETETCSLKQVASLDVITSKDGWPLVPIGVGRGTLHAAIDFGAPYSILEERIAHELQLKLVTFERDSRYILEGLAKYGTSVPLKMGNAFLEDAPFAVTQQPLANDPDVTAYLALDILTKFDVELDLAHHKINLFSKDHCTGKVVYWTKSAPVSSLPMELTATDRLRIPIQANGKNVDAIISPVSEGLYVNPHRAMQNLGIEIQSRDLPTMADHNQLIQLGRPSPAVSLGIKSVSIDGITFLNPVTHVLDCLDLAAFTPIITCSNLPPVVIGVSELAKLRVYLDFQDRRLYATIADAD